MIKTFGVLPTVARQPVICTRFPFHTPLKCNPFRLIKKLKKRTSGSEGKVILIKIFIKKGGNGITRKCK